MAGYVSNIGQSAITSATADPNSWNGQTVIGSSTKAFINTYVNPNVTGTNVTSTLWQTLDDNSTPTKLGFFTLSANGILTFNTTVTALPPVPQIVSVTRAGNTSTIYFSTTNGFTYTLYYTNSAGLTAPVSSWAVSVTSISGNGLTNSLADTTATTNRFYRIGVH